MRRPYVFLLLVFLIVAPVANGQDSGFATCSEEDLLVYVDSILDISLLDASPVETLDDLVTYAAGRIDSRENRFRLVPLCAEAIAMQRNDFFITGDLIGRSALQMAGLPNASNPYVLMTPNLEDLREANREILSRADSDEAAAEDRVLPPCTFRQNFKLESLATNHDVMLLKASKAEGADEWINALDQLLQWRHENLSTLPECLEAIEVGFLLSKAATDAALQFALRYAGVADERNPYIAAVDRAREKLRFWRDEITLTRPENDGAAVLILGKASELPSCNSVEIAYVYSTFLDEVQDVAEIGQDFESPAVMIDYAEAHIDLRSDTLSRFPPCAELFEIAWWSQEYLDANAGYVSHLIIGYSPERNPFAARLIEASDAFVAWSERAAASLRAGNGIEGPAPDERVVAACQPGEIAYMIGYLIPEFRAFVRAGLAIESAADNLPLMERSFSLRDRLWSSLPRCSEALEIGLLMRKILGDWLSMQAVHNILGRDDNRYAAQVQGALDLFLAMSDAFTGAAVGESHAAASPSPPLIAPERSTQLPACTDADQVETLTRLLEPIQALHSRAPNVEDVQDLLAFSRRALEIREELMPPVKLCAENFDYIWLNIQAMNDMVIWLSMFLDGLSMADIPLTDYTVGEAEQIIAWDERVKEIARNDVWDEDENTDISDVPTCSNADLAFLVARIVPQFRSFANATIAARSKAEYYALVDELISYRDKLRAGLPRCQEALEIGLAMLKTAGDLVSMFALNYAGLATEDIPYLEPFEKNSHLIMTRIDEWVDALALDEAVVESQSTVTYYVTANPYANIRACASTNCDIVATAQNGKALAVVDDSADWFEMRLEDGRTAFIAGFLMSKTPPES